jgi:hypothetical protein
MHENAFWHTTELEPVNSSSKAGCTLYQPGLLEIKLPGAPNLGTVWS